MQLGLWPEKPSDIVLSSLLNDKRGVSIGNKKRHIPGKLPRGTIVVDSGCGDASIARKLLTSPEHPGVKVHSFDMHAPENNCITPYHSTEAIPLVTVANMSSLPLADNTADIVIMCLSLMSTEWPRYIREAYRVLKNRKLLKVIEVRSRIPSPLQFQKAVESLGFSCDWFDIASNYFIAFDFCKLDNDQSPKNMPAHKLAEVLTPCAYKRR